VADASDPMVEERIESVDKILEQTGYESIPRMIVLNKADKADPGLAARLARRFGAALISARDKNSLPELTELLEQSINGILHTDVDGAGNDFRLYTA